MPLIIQPYQSQVQPQLQSQPRGHAIQQTDYTAQALGQMGEVLTRAHERIQSRSDAIERARDYGTFFETSNQELLKRSSEQDFSRPEAIKEYAEYLQESMGKTVREYRGSEDGRAALFMQLESTRLNLVSQAAAMSNKMQREMLGNHFMQYQNQFTKDVYDNPASILEKFKEWDNVVDDKAGALQQDEEGKLKNEGRAAMIRATIESFMAKGQTDKAKEVLTLPFVKETMNEEDQRRYFRAIFKAKGDSERLTETEKAQEKIDAFKYVMNREPGPAELMRILGQETGQGGVRGPFGSDENANIIAVIGDKFEKGLATPEEQAYLEQAYNKEFMQPKPTMVTDPDTGIPRVTYQMPTMTPRQQRIAGMLGLDRRRSTSQPFISDAQPRQSITQPQQQIAPIGQAVAEQTQARKYDALTDHAKDIAGIVPAVSSLITGMPLGGEIATEGMKREKAAVQRAKSVQSLFTSSLQGSYDNKNDSRAMAEIKQLEERFNVMNQLIGSGNEVGYKIRLHSMATELSKRMKSDLMIANDKTQTLEVRKQARNHATAINGFLDAAIGRPIVITQEDYNSVKVGEEYLGSDGVIRIKPAPKKPLK